MRKAFLAMGVALVLMSHVQAQQGGAAGSADLFPEVPAPAGNPVTTARVMLGKALFWEEQLSSSRTVACGTCHIPGAGGSDPRSTQDSVRHPGADGVFGNADDVRGSPGVIFSEGSGHYLADAVFPVAPQVTGRKAPTMINAAFFDTQFWDGRADDALVDPLSGDTVLATGASLETQVLGPPLSDVEMGHLDREWADVTSRLAAAQPLALASEVPEALKSWIDGRDYGALFTEAFGTAEITPARLAMAIAGYERTLVSDEAPIDAFLAGDVEALTPAQRQGWQIFTGPASCSVCHAPPLLSSGDFANIGVRPPEEDLGLAGVTGSALDNGKFKIPTLRNVALRPPLFHNGGADDLVDVIDFYNRGGDFSENQSPLVRPLGLSAIQRGWLLDLLTHAFTDPRVAGEAAPFDRPRLASESDALPALLAPGHPGTEGIAPRMVALEPPLLGSDHIAIAVADGRAGAPVLLGLSLDAAPDGTVIEGMPLHLDPSLMSLRPMGVLQDDLSGRGFTSWVQAVPDDAAAAGLIVVAQWFIADDGAEGGLAASEGARFRLFPAGGAGP